MTLRACPVCGNVALRVFVERVPFVQTPEGDWEIEGDPEDLERSILQPKVTCKCTNPHCGEATDAAGNTLPLNEVSTMREYLKIFYKLYSNLFTEECPQSVDELTETQKEEFDEWYDGITWESWEGPMEETISADDQVLGEIYQKRQQPIDVDAVLKDLTNN